MDSTERLSLPLIVPGQAQKEMVHNEALQLLDGLVAGAVEDVPANDPPPSPETGRCYLVGDSPTSEWAQYAQHVAAYTTAGWRFIPPTQGMLLLVKTTQTFAVYGAAGWEIGSIRGAQVIVNGDRVISDRSAAIGDPAGGTVIDGESRSALVQILSVLRHHGLISS